MAVRLGLLLSALVVALGAVWSIWAYLANRGTDVAGLGFAVALFYGVIALVCIWVGVLVTLVVRIAGRVSNDAPRS